LAALVIERGAPAAGCGEEVVPASDYRALHNRSSTAMRPSCRRSPPPAWRQIRELHRLLGKKTLETEILKEALNTSATVFIAYRPSAATAAAAAVFLSPWCGSRHPQAPGAGRGLKAA
jgi:hypothetical protein